MKKMLFGFIFLFISFSLFSQSKKRKDINAIKQMCGCFEVRFNFAETFVNSVNQDYVPSKNYKSGALEWAQLIFENSDQISIQHILITGEMNSPYIIKHWRQDWLHENQDFYIYDHNNKWNYNFKTKKEVKGQWTQKVYQVDDSPRYEGTSTWVHVDNKSFWENITPAPLPRREYTKRSDYNVTLRGNRHEISLEGWIHDQDNAKVIRESGKKDVILSYEKGYNEYRRVSDEKCISAKKWWKKNQNKWEKVRQKWRSVYDRKTELTLARKKDGSPLFIFLFDQKVKNQKEISSIIESFIVY
ncbi:MAG: hypothetical protein CMC67_06100 [Flavobacteriaceae bacterium]|nr:hypothetical protein [Flavobacteriaceae bacterium]